MGETADFKKEQQLYYKVFGSLAVLTVITVAISNLKVGIAMAVVLALAVATVKASLVASFFMHLLHERKLIYIVMGLTAFFFVFMMMFFIFAYHSVPEGFQNTNFEYGTKQMSGHHDETAHDKHHKEKAGGQH